MRVTVLSWLSTWFRGAIGLCDRLSYKKVAIIRDEYIFTSLNAMSVTKEFCHLMESSNWFSDSIEPCTLGVDVSGKPVVVKTMGEWLMGSGGVDGRLRLEVGRGKLVVMLRADAPEKARKFVEGIGRYYSYQTAIKRGFGNYESFKRLC